MGARRRLAAVALVAPLLVPVVPAAPAAAHGAPQRPLSRGLACGPEGGAAAKSAACRAAASVSAEGVFEQWHNIRMPNVQGRERKVIPDGELCSGGIDAYAGLDLPRKDWPTTKVRPGAEYAFAYRTTIPHPGTFRFYVTKAGFSPTQPLRWANLGTKPFLAVENPPLRDGSYRMKGKLPTGLKGRHLIYTVWQTSDSTDTYYSCSDVVFTGGSKGESETRRSTDAPPGGTATSGAAAPPAADETPSAQPWLARNSVVLAGSAGLVALAVALLAVGRRRLLARRVANGGTGPGRRRRQD